MPTARLAIALQVELLPAGAAPPNNLLNIVAGCDKQTLDKRLRICYLYFYCTKPREVATKEIIQRPLHGSTLT